MKIILTLGLVVMQWNALLASQVESSPAGTSAFRLGDATGAEYALDATFTRGDGSKQEGRFYFHACDEKEITYGSRQIIKPVEGVGMRSISVSTTSAGIKVTLASLLKGDGWESSSEGAINAPPLVKREGRWEFGHYALEWTKLTGKGDAPQLGK